MKKRDIVYDINFREHAAWFNQSTFSKVSWLSLQPCIWSHGGYKPTMCVIVGVNQKFHFSR